LKFSDKFNGTVPGTFQPDNDNTQLYTDHTGEDITTVDSVSTTVTDIMVESITKLSVFVVGGTLFFILLIGVGGGIFFSFIVVCILVGFSVRRKRKSHHRHAQGIAMLYCILEV
jgi:hypothetical protein